MARIERINLEGTTYDLGAIATTSAPGVVRVGSGLSIDANGILSVSGGGGGTMPLYTSLGENTDGPITQKASREMIYADANKQNILIGSGGTASYSAGIGIGTYAAQARSVTLGYNAVNYSNTGAGYYGSVAIGPDTYNGAGYGVAIGYNAKVAPDGRSDTAQYGDWTSWAVALGAGAQPSRTSEVNIGTPRATGKGYNGTDYRILGGVHDGIDNHDAVTVGQLNAAIAGVTLPVASASTLGGIKVGTGLSIDNDGVLSANSATLYSSTGQNTDGAMTQKATTDALALKADSSSLATVATTGDYADLLNTPSPYSLPTASANDLGGVKVGTGLSIDANGVLSATGTSLPLYTALGENADGPVTQQTTRRAIYADSDRQKVAIRGQNASADISASVPAQSTHVGYSSEGLGAYGAAFGAYAKSGNSSNNTSHATALGYSANAQKSYSVALGAGATTSEKGEINVTTASTTGDTHGYNNTRFRLIRGVYPGVQDNDAATVGQLNTAIASAVSPITDAEIDAICV